MLIPLIEYALRNNKAPCTATQRARRGAFKTAIKIGRDWFIDDREIWQDNRIKSGNYRDWRKNKDENKL